MMQPFRTFLIFSGVLWATIGTLEVFAADQILPVPGPGRDIRPPVIPRPGVRPAPIAQPRALEILELQGKYADLGMETTALTCESWKGIFEEHYNILRRTHRAAQKLRLSLERGLSLTSADDGRREWLEDVFEEQERAATEFEEVSSLLESFTSADFFDAKSLSVVWKAPLKEIAPQFESFSTVSGETVRSRKWEKIEVHNPLIHSVLEHPFEDDSSSFEVWQDSETLFIRAEVKPVERCLIAPSWGGQLAPTGQDLSNNAIFLNLELQLHYISRNSRIVDGADRSRSFKTAAVVSLQLP